jgi:hypothetical protein
MNELDLVRSVAPIGDEHVAALDLDGAELELMEEIMSTPAITASRPRTLRWRPVALVAAVAAAAILAITLAPGGGTRPEFAAAAVRVAEANARILVGESGWRIAAADEFTRDEGEVTFAHGSERFEVHWYPAALHRSYSQDRADAAAPADVTVLGRAATRYGRATILPPDDRSFTELRGDDMSVGRYLEVLRSLKTADVETWLAAMPPTVVKPGARAPLVDEMLRDVPVPDRVDVNALRSGGVHDTYQLTVDVMTPIACGWLDQWTAAKKSGDRAVAAEAERALQTARDWPAFRNLPRGQRDAWPSEVFRYADEMKSGRLGDYRQSLGCR